VERLIAVPGEPRAERQAFGKQFEEFIGSDRTWRYRIIAWRERRTKAAARRSAQGFRRGKVDAADASAGGEAGRRERATARFFWEMPFAAMMRSPGHPTAEQSDRSAESLCAGHDGHWQKRGGVGAGQQKARKTRRIAGCTPIAGIAKRKSCCGIGAALGIFDPDVKGAIVRRGFLKNSR
jgi:hypothetical protein